MGYWKNGCEEIKDGEKRCSRCARWLPLDEFYRNSAHRSGLYSSCIACTILARNPGKVRALSAQVIIDGKKRCSKCGLWLTIDNFGNMRAMRSGLNSTCRQCLGSKYRAINTQKVIGGKKQCSRCHELKTLDNFSLDKHLSSGMVSDCKECGKKRRQQWASKPENHEKLIQMYRKRRQREDVKEITRLQKERYKPIRRETERNRLKEDPTYRLNQCIRVNMHDALKKWGGRSNKNGRKWERLVGYSVKDLERRLRRTIPKGFTWQDFMEGRLHIDHIVPRSAFNFTSADDLDFKRCYALKNLRLLSAYENMTKHARLQGQFQPALPFAVNIQKR